MNQKSKIKVLLYADRKVGNSLVIERVIYNLKQSLKAANIDFTEDLDDEYDIAHFLSARDIIANESTLIKNKVPIILHGFCDYEDFEITSLGNYALKKETERVDNLVDAIFGTMSIISRIIYALVGISGLWGIKLLFDD